uniref:Uncharacterized protein n=1 Tax=Monodelphis domestica TaxID=13616 RepID=F7BVU7_MONDO
VLELGKMQFPSLWEGASLKSLLLFSAVFLMLASYLQRRRRHPNYPPGPFQLPFLGNFFHMDHKNPHMAFYQLAKKYGNIFSLELVGCPVIVVTGLSLIKEVLVNQGQVFVDRPHTPLRSYVFKKLGLIMSNGQEWKDQRRFTLMTLRNFGLGKRTLELRIQEEAMYLTEAIREEKGQPFDPHFQINNAVSNIICSVTFGNRFEYHDSQFRELLKILDEAMMLQTNLPFSFKGNISPSFSEDNLVSCTLDLFLAGTETTSTTLRWALLYMALCPEIQGKIQAEIDRVVGQSRLPTMADRENMPYTNAAVHEIQRMGNIVPFNVPRMSTVDTTVAGYHVPKVNAFCPMNLRWFHGFHLPWGHSLLSFAVMLANLLGVR